MSTEITYPHIEKPTGSVARLRRFPRIRVSQIAMDYLAHGWTADEIHRQHPSLSLGEIHSAMAYTFDHQEEIDGEIRAEIDEVRESRRRAEESPLAARLRARGLL